MKFLISTFFFLSFFASCEQAAGQQEITREELDRQFKGIEAFIAEGNCSSKDQCSFMPYGSKACGGPQGFLVFSTAIDVDKLRTMVNDYTEAEKRYNNANGIMSDCSIPAEPQKLECKDGKCIRVI